MKCALCKHGQTKPGTATITLERDKLTLVLKEVPADVCSTCGEEYVNEETTKRLFEISEEVVRSGAIVDIRTYQAALCASV